MLTIIPRNEEGFVVLNINGEDIVPVDFGGRCASRTFEFSDGPTEIFAAYDLRKFVAGASVEDLPEITCSKFTYSEYMEIWSAAEKAIEA